MKRITTIIIAILSIGSIVGTNLFADYKLNDPEHMILGEWISENNPDFKWHFYSDGTLKFKDSGQLYDEVVWEIVNECEGETADNEYDFAMLEITYDVNDKQCYVVQGLNGVLTLLALPQGRLIIFDRVEN